MKFLNKMLLLLSLVSLNSIALFAEGSSSAKQEKRTVEELISRIHKRIEKWSWDHSLFPQKAWSVGGYSVDGYPLITWQCGDEKSSNRSLILSAVHGDEITPVYYGFRLVEWLKARPELCNNKFIVVAPLVNPDGFLRYKTGTRTNYNKVDLNRNFETPEWKHNAQRLWESRYRKARRYFPGDQPGSEPETQFQKDLIAKVRPSKILSVHAPLNFLDYDGPHSELKDEFSTAYLDSCSKLKYEIMAATPSLRYQAYGTFPGSLGNYAGKHLGIPTITAELPTTEAAKAGAYFAILERGTKRFIDFDIQGQNIQLGKKLAIKESETD